MSLENKLKEYDSKVVTHKTVVIDGRECVIVCYPKVKDMPSYYNNRIDIIKMYQQQNKKGQKK